MQLKAIFSDLLRSYAFELSQPSESYRNDHSKMVVQLEQPCRARYRRRKELGSSPAAGKSAARAALPGGSCRLRVDLDLCQGHGVCTTEAPGVFAVVENEENEERERKVVLLTETPSEEQREGVELAVRHCPTGALSIDE